MTFDTEWEHDEIRRRTAKIDPNWQPIFPQLVRATHEITTTMTEMADVMRMALYAMDQSIEETSDINQLGLRQAAAKIRIVIAKINGEP